MNEPSEKRLGVLKIERSFNATQEEVFAAFTNPEIMAKWFFGFPEGSVQVEVDLRVGGKYSVTMFASEANSSATGSACISGVCHYGEYLAIAPPDRLEFTWIRDGFVDYSEVTIELSQAGSHTLVSLTHRVPTATIPQHTGGWNACLDNLRKYLA